MIKTTNPPVAPIVGDLVYCHCIGSIYGWYLDEVGIVVAHQTSHYVGANQKNQCRKADRLPNDKKYVELFAQQYDIYLPTFQKTLKAEYNAFENGDVEIITKYKTADVAALMNKTKRVNNMLGIDDMR
jgi:hypothetical protein